MINLPLTEAWRTFLARVAQPPQSEGATVVDYRARYVIPITDVVFDQGVPPLQAVRDRLRLAVPVTIPVTEAPYNATLSGEAGFVVPSGEIWRVRTESFVFREGDAANVNAILAPPPPTFNSFGMMCLGERPGVERHALGGVIGPSANLAGAFPYQIQGENPLWYRVPAMGQEQISFGPETAVAIHALLTHPAFDQETAIELYVDLELDRYPTRRQPWPPAHPEPS